MATVPPQPFLPVILGTDINAYGMARAFHEAYGIRSLALGRSAQYFTADSAIIDVSVAPGFDTDPAFRDQIVKIGEDLKAVQRNLLLVPCSDGYVELVSRNRDVLEALFLFNTVDESLRQKLENKQNFYASCAETGLPCPDTVVVNAHNWQTLALPFGYPVAVKPDDSIAYVKLKFPGKKKAYKAETEADLREILSAIYQAGYTGDMILQDYIPGGVDTMYVLNAYVDQHGAVRMTSTARCALDECLPEDIGNYNALISGDFPDVDAQCKAYLEQIGYRGFANFDLKYDVRDGRYKVFEINLRQGRSSFYVTASGCNLATWLVDDLLGAGCQAYHRHTKEHLWLNVAKRVLRDYTTPEMKPAVQRLLSEKNLTYTLDYGPDHSLKRRLSVLRRRLSTRKYYPKYCARPE